MGSVPSDYGTGQPARDCRSVTILAPDTMTSDACQPLSLRAVAQIIDVIPEGFYRESSSYKFNELWMPDRDIRA